MKKLILLLLLTYATELHAQGAYQASRIVLYSGLAFDLGTTEVAIRGGAVESNPILGQNRFRRVGVATGLTVGTDLLTKVLRQDHPKVATVFNFIAGSVHFGAGAWNIHQTKPINRNGFTVNILTIK